MSAPVLDRWLRPAPGSPAAPVTPRSPTVAGRTAAALAVVAMLVAVVSSFPSGGFTSSVAARVVSGPVEAADGDGWRALAVGDPVRDGTLLRTVGGAGVLEVDAGQVHLASGSRTTVASDAVTVHRGTVAVDVERPISLQVGGLLARGAGIWRVDLATRPRVATYTATVTVDDGGTRIEVPAYRQLTVRDGALGGAAVLPLRYLADDEFDRRWLAEAFRVDDLAASVTRSLAGTYGTAPRDPAFFAAFTAVEPGVRDRLVDLAAVVDGDHLGPPADLLVAAAAIDALATVSDRSREAVAAGVADLRRAGATWGLVLVDGGAGAGDLAAAVDRALEQAAQDPPPTAAELAAALPEPEATPPPPAAGGDPEDPTSQPPPTTGGTPPPGGDDDGGGDGDGPSLLDPIDDLVEDTGETLEDLVDDTTDLLGDLIDGVDDLLSPSDDGGLLGGVGGLLGG